LSSVASSRSIALSVRSSRSSGVRKSSTAACVCAANSCGDISPASLFASKNGGKSATIASSIFSSRPSPIASVTCRTSDMSTGCPPASTTFAPPCPCVAIPAAATNHFANVCTPAPLSTRKRADLPLTVTSSVGLGNPMRCSSLS